MARRRWLTPNVIEEADTVCRPLSIDRTLLPYVTGALLPLTQPWEWELSGTMTEQEASELFTVMLEGLQGPCDTPSICTVPADPDFGIDIDIKIIRRASTGATQELIDGVWSPPTGDYEVPPVPAREELTADERRCLAAANAANVLDDLYEEVTDEIAGGLTVAEVMSAIYGYAIGILGLFAGTTAVAYASLGRTFLDTFIDTVDILGGDVWTTPFTDELACLLYDHSTDTAGVVTFNWATLRAAITEKFQDAVGAIEPNTALLWGQVGYLFDILAEGGINHAGATTAITVYECDCIDGCGLRDFEGGFPYTIIDGTVVDGVGEDGGKVLAANNGGTFYRLDVEIPIDCDLTEMQWRIKFNSSRGDNMLSWYVQTWYNNGASSVTTGTGDLDSGPKNTWNTRILTPFNVAGATKQRIQIAVSGTTNTYIYLDRVAFVGTEP